MKKGFEISGWTKRQVTAQEAIDVMLPINETNQLWKMNIYMIALFAAFFIALFFYAFTTEEIF